MNTEEIEKIIKSAREKMAFDKMWDDLNSTMNKLLKAKIGPSEREEFLKHLPSIIKGLHIDGHADKAHILEKKLAKYARNLRLPLEPLLDTDVVLETKEETKKNAEEIL